MDYKIQLFFTVLNISIIGYGTYKDWKRKNYMKNNVYSEKYWRDSYGDFDSELFWNFMCKELEHVITCQETFLRFRVTDKTILEEFDKNIDERACCNNCKKLSGKVKFNNRINIIMINSDILRTRV